MAFLKRRPFQSISKIIWNHVESIGTKAYTIHEVKELFSKFSIFSAVPIYTPYDEIKYLAFFNKMVPHTLGWFITLRGVK